MISREEYREKTQKLLTGEDFEAFNDLKKKKKLTLCVVLPIQAVLLAIAISMCFVNTIAAGVVFGLLTLSFIIGAVGVFGFLTFDFKAFRNRVIQGVFDILLEGYKYNFDPTKVLSSKEFACGGFAGRFDSYSGEDLFEIYIPDEDGNPSDVKLRMSDVCAERRETRTVRDSNGNYYTEEYWVTVFAGMFGYIVFPENFKCALSINSEIAGTKKIQLEDIKFNKQFNVKTNDHVEALCILTPTLMRKIMDFQEKMSSMLQFSLYNNWLFIAIHRDFFELKKTKEFTSEMFDRIYDDASSIVSIVEEIRTNKSFPKKQKD